MSPHIAECLQPPISDEGPIKLEPVEIDPEDAFAVLYNKYNTFEHFKTHMDSKVIEDTPLILGKYEPISMTYLRTGLYTLHYIYDSFPDKPEDIAIISDQFYNNMLIFDKNIVYNILENMAIINMEKNDELLYTVVADCLRIEKERQSLGFTDFEMRAIRLIANGFEMPTALQTKILNYKVPLDLVRPWKLPESEGVPNIMDQLIKDIQTKTSIYQNYYGVHDLPDSIMEKIISDTVKIYHTDTNFWHDFNGADSDIRGRFKEAIIEEFKDYYLQQPHASKLQLQIYINTKYYFSREDT